MAHRIDFYFISALEGGSRVVGYVPNRFGSKSGVTIATGFDLGQRGEDDLRRLGLTADLIMKLVPYLGSGGTSVLEKMPLEITPAEARQIDVAVKARHVMDLRMKYDATGTATKFIDLPPEAQTVIASVSFQYGTGLDRATPRFWKAVTHQDWKSAVVVLRNFGDAYPTRRRKEAALLERVVK